MEKILALKKTREIVKRLTPEQRLPIETEIVALFALYKRPRLKLIAGGRGANKR